MGGLVLALVATLNVILPCTTVFSVIACLGYIVYLHIHINSLYAETQLNVEFVEAHQKAIKQLGDNQKILNKAMNDIRIGINKVIKQNKEMKNIDSVPVV